MRARMARVPTEASMASGRSHLRAGDGVQQASAPGGVIEAPSPEKASMRRSGSRWVPDQEMAGHPDADERDSAATSDLHEEDRDRDRNAEPPVEHLVEVRVPRVVVRVGRPPGHRASRTRRRHTASTSAWPDLGRQGIEPVQLRARRRERGRHGRQSTAPPRRGGSRPQRRAMSSRHLGVRLHGTTTVQGTGEPCRVCCGLVTDPKNCGLSVIQRSMRAEWHPEKSHVAVTDEETNEGSKGWNRQTGQQQGTRFASAAVAAVRRGVDRPAAAVGTLRKCGASFSPRQGRWPNAVLRAPALIGEGYWQVSAQGGVFTNGAAAFYGSAGATTQQADCRASPRASTGVATGSWRPTAASSPSATRRSRDRPGRSTSTQPIVGHRADARWPGLLARGLRRRCLRLR